MSGTSPLVIGGVGGGGTRIYRKIAQLAGYKMLGAPWWIERNSPPDCYHDNYLMRLYFYPKWIEPYMKGKLTKFDKWRMRAECRLYLWLCGPLSYNKRDKKWGFKNPNTLFLIPFLSELFTSMRYLLVVRDGRHHAFHKRFDYTKGTSYMLSDDDIKLPKYIGNALYWSRCNQRVRETVSQYLQNDQLLICRFEDLIADPIHEISRIFSFLECDDKEQIRAVAKLVQTPKSFNQWKNESAKEIAEVERYIGRDLIKYGYKRNEQ